MYQIEIHYQTGDSFHNEDREQRIDFVWTNLEVAEENLQRIKEHYEMYQKTNHNYHASFKEMKKEYGDKPWFVGVTSKSKSNSNLEFLAGHSIMLIKDDGEAFQFSTFWTGYFECLYGASIVHAELPSFKASYF